MITSKQTVGICVITVVVAALGYRSWSKHQPPYELGFHSTIVEAGSNPGAAGDAPHVENCPVFPADNVWNTPIDKLKKDRQSDAYIASIGPQQKMHPDFAGNLKYGMPYTMVPPGTRLVNVSFSYSDESDPGPYPIPDNAPMEGNGQGDSHVIVIDQQHCMLYELYAAQFVKGQGWTAGAGIAMNLRSNALRPTNKTSADAAGLPIFPGLVRYDEVAAGEIKHALRFTVPHTQNIFVWPARHQSGNAGANLVPMGMRFRLKEDFDISKFSFSNRVILTALKRYGMFMADNGSPLYLSGVPDKRWDDSDLHHLNQVTADDLEAVDESGLEVQLNSAKAAQPK